MVISIEREGATFEKDLASDVSEINNSFKILRILREAINIQRYNRIERSNQWLP
ncbi:hypothetical protein QUB13_10090 [Microcoleus sp. B4-D4]